MRTWTIELRADFGDDEEKKQIMLQATKLAAKTLYTQAMLICERKPDICVETEDYFGGRETIEMHDDGSA